MDFEDVTYWIRGTGLEIVLIVMTSVLLARAVRWAADHLIMRADLRAAAASDWRFMTSENSKHKRSLVQVIAWVSTSVIGFVTFLLVVQKIGLPLTSFVAPATVLGAAIGFGSQRVVQDLLSGFFLFTERQYGVGDVVRVSPPGTGDGGITGTVEEVTLRSTRLRTVNGEVVVLPNGEIRQVTNLSRNWAQVVLDIPVSSSVDVEETTRILNTVGSEMRGNDTWMVRLLTTPEVLGIERLGAGIITLRLVARTLPGSQWDVGRELRSRIFEAFKRSEIEIEELTARELI